MNLSKNALIVGATGGVGKAIVEELTKEGYFVVLSARNKDRLEALSQSLPPTNTSVLPVNLESRESIEKLFVEVNKLLEQPLSLIVVASGGWVPNQFDDNLAGFEKDLSTMVSQNLTGPALALFAGAQYLNKNGGGLLVNISSHAAHKNLKGNLAYGPVKSAINWFTKLLNDEVGESVRITDILPAVINTDSMTAQLGDQADKAIQPADIAKTVALLTKLSPHTTISEIHMDANVTF